MSTSPETGRAAADFDRTTAVEAIGGGAYRGTIDPGWFGPPGPNGGFIAALVLRAIRAEVSDAERLPRSLTLHYLRPPAEGEATIEVLIERSGRSATSCSATMRQHGKVTTLALCVLSVDYEGIADWEPEAPVAPRPAEVAELELGAGAPPLFEQLETRPVFGSPPFSSGPEALTGGWLRARGDGELTPELIALYTDAWWPAPFSRLDGPSAAPTLELTIHFRAQPAPGERHALVRFRSEASIGGLFDEGGEVWSEGGRLLAQSRQLALLRPLK